MALPSSSFDTIEVTEVDDDIAAGRLISLLDDFAAPPNGIYAVFPQRKHLPLRVRLWIDFLKHSWGDAAYWQGGSATYP